MKEVRDIVSHADVASLDSTLGAMGRIAQRPKAHPQACYTPEGVP